MSFFANGPSWAGGFCLLGDGLDKFCFYALLNVFGDRPLEMAVDVFGKDPRLKVSGRSLD